MVNSAQRVLSLLAHGSGDLTTLFGVLGYVLLIFAPGAWITFGCALDGISFWVRLMTGVMLSPLVVCAEFYVIRLIGVPFGSTAVILVIFNLSAVYLIWKRRGQVASQTRSDWLMGTAAVAICVGCMLSLLITRDARIYSAHAWIYADPAYLFARGQLILEDPTLAGIKLTYPVWSGLVFQTVSSFLVNSPPITCYVWTNLLWLIVNYGLVMAITREMGGGKLAQFSSGIWLFIGTNPVGYVLMNLAPAGMSHQLWGDARYTPWVSKFQLFSTMELGLGMLFAMIYLLVRSGPLTTQLLATVGLLLCGIGLFYPLLFPSAFGVIGAKGLALLAEKQNQKRTLPYKEWLTLACVLFAGVLATYVQLRLLASDKPITPSLVQWSSISSAVRKVFESFVVTSLLLAGVALTFRNCWNSRRNATIFLLAGALVNYVLHAAFHILFFDNEYKFIFATAMCLAVFPALAMEHAWREWPRAKAVPVLAAIGLLLFGTYGHWAYVNWPYLGLKPGHQSKPYATSVDTSTFYVQLNKREAWFGVCNAVRRLTPADAVLLLKQGAFYYPGFTARSLYVAPLGESAYPGVNLDADELDAYMRGNGRQIVETRRATLTEFFDTKDPIQREQALDTILSLNRPVAVIAEPHHSDLLEWLKQRKTAVELYASNGLSLWLIDGGTSMRVADTSLQGGGRSAE
jgi:hypothetical protein